MKRISQELVGMGFEVALFNFPFAQERKTKPDPEPVLVGAMEFVAKAARDERDIRLILGGKSLGARIAALTISMGYVCDGALFLGFPLHLPEKNLDNRDELLREVNVPMLFIQGTRDIFCHLDLLQNTLGRLDAPSTLHLIEGAEHSYVVKNRSQRDVYTEIVQVIDRWLKDI